jgi:hypothetical protein
LGTPTKTESKEIEVEGEASNNEFSNLDNLIKDVNAEHEQWV